MKRSEPARFSYRMLAISGLAIAVVGVAVAAAIRETEAETTPAATTANPYATIAVSGNDAPSGEPASPQTSTARIRFGAAISSDGDASAPGGPTTRGAEFADYYAQQRPATEGRYAVTQAAAEAPVRGTPTPAPAQATTSATASADASGTASSDPFARNPAPPSAPLSKTPLPPPPNPLPTSAGAVPAPFGPAAGDRYAAPPATAMPSATPAPTATAPSSLPPSSAYTPASSMPTATATPTASAPIAAPPPRSFDNPPAARSAPVPFAAQPAAAEPVHTTPTTETSPPRTFSMPVAGPAGTGKPGEQALEGAQTPTLVVEKFAPPEIQIGKPAVFEIVVRNTGNSVANNVEIHDIVPHGTQLTSSTPKAATGTNGQLIWQLGALRPGDEATVQVELMPTTEGEIGSVATVHFAASASARTVCTKPDLAIEVSAPRSVMVGDEVPLKIRVFNPGTGAATGVYLTEVVPSGMEHAAGGELEYEIGDLQPGETRELELALRAVKAGACMNVIHGKGDGRVAAETKTQFEIVAPALAVDIEGPKRRFLDRQATYTVSLTNPGTAAAREVELATYLPRGMQFVDADNHGEYDQETHSVRWLLEELPPQQRGTVSLTALPVEPGQQLFRVESSADRGISARKEEAVLVEGVASIVFQVGDTVDPIEVGGETEYEILVANQGSKEATNVQLTVTLPEGFKAVDAEGPAKYSAAGRQIQFQALPQLPAKSETTFVVRAQCLKAGDHRCLVQLTSDDMKLPVTKEEGTQVFAEE
ncbi:MAG: DUF11 domain-containing protein [Planctomycetales bacterium]|nr:DUF11 domain-containing protein [Planctomycetales bacterium]